MHADKAQLARLAFCGMAAFAISTWMSAFGVELQDMSLSQDMYEDSLDSMSTFQIGVVDGETQVVVSNGDGVARLQLQEDSGMTFRCGGNGVVKFQFDDDAFNSPVDRLLVNGKPLGELIAQLAQRRASAPTVKSVVEAATYNPLWGKKLAAIGDSLITSPAGDVSYAAQVAARNNMTLVHKGRSGEALCTGKADNPSCISSYTNDIPKDADYILCHIGANDGGIWNASVPDDDMSLDTFKGCWNQLLLGLKKNYPNAKIGVIVANSWQNNVGRRSEDAIPNTTLRVRTQWQKKQAQKLNMPIFDPLEDTRFIVWNYRTYATNAVVTSSHIPDSVLDWHDKIKRDIGTANLYFNVWGHMWVSQTPYFTDTWHCTEKGHLALSYFYEKWMKRELNSN